MPVGTKHSAGTNLNREGVDLRTIQKLFGHSDTRSTMRYVALGDDTLLDAVARPASTTA
jgi:site-specific recombinase XerD